MNELNTIRNQGQYDVAPKLKPVQPQQINMSSPVANSGALGGSVIDKLMRAIKSKESTNNYGAYNNQSGASGGYQVLRSNFEPVGKGWDREALGRDVSFNEFMHSPQIQDQIARYKLSQYLQQYGSPEIAAAVWYGGPGAAKNMNSHTTQAGGYPSIYAYWNDVLSKM
jgi:hypothetical protein